MAAKISKQSAREERHRLYWNVDKHLRDAQVTSLLAEELDSANRLIRQLQGHL